MPQQQHHLCLWEHDFCYNIFVTKCLVSGCNNKYRSIGLCSSHWKINKKYGNPEPKCFCGELIQTFAGNVGAQLFCKFHSLEKRYWDNVDQKSDNECWEWKAAKTKAGYGIIYYDKKNRFAHRLSLEFQGINIPEKMYVCHKCDNPPCVNPNHLYVGTPYQNSQDKVNRNRHPKGDRHYNYKLSENDVLEIRKLFLNGVFQSDIARLFNINASYVSDIINNKARIAQ